MDLTVDEIINQLDELMDSISYHEHLYVALELAQGLRDELLTHSEDYEDDED